MDYNIKILAGSPHILGANIIEQGVNFAIFSRHATVVTIYIFDKFEDKESIVEHEFDPVYNKTGDIWHCFIEGVKEGMWYGYTVDAVYIPEFGYRFNHNKFLIDPYAKIVKLKKPLNEADSFSYQLDSDTNTFCTIKNFDKAPRCMIVKNKGYQGIKSVSRPFKDQIIYEMHVRGFTQDKSSNVKNRGSFLGVIEKIPYLKDLGITAIELLPIYIFDHLSSERTNKKGDKLKNYWGYDPINFMGIHTNYSITKDTDIREEFKYMVSELHKEGIDIYLDVVFNHTGEGNEKGITVSFKGLDNTIYYMLSEGGRKYRNYTGCGNTLNCNHPVVRELIIDTLVYWVVEMGVDGFRFDLASVLARDRNGNLLSNSPLIDTISENPILRDRVMIAEAWDAAGAYQLGSFGTDRWGEWNGKFRDDIRSFVKSDYGTLRLASERLMGSRDIYMLSSKNPENSINFITCHDGFTLQDLVSYNNKYNILNGEENKDGTDYNLSWNCGIEGETDDKEVLELRDKQKRNFMTVLMLSLGVPMILAGDEFGNSQKGNNNAYCQDNEVSWLNWNDLEKNKAFFRFVKNLIGFRKNNPVLRINHYYKTTKDFSNPVEWYGIKGKEPNWKSDNFHVACFVKSQGPPLLRAESDEIFFILNMHWEEHIYYFPKIKNKKWHFVLDTSLDSPNDIVDLYKDYKLDDQKKYIINPRSIAVFIARKTKRRGV